MAVEYMDWSFKRHVHLWSAPPLRSLSLRCRSEMDSHAELHAPRPRGSGGLAKEGAAQIVRYAVEIDPVERVEQLAAKFQLRLFSHPGKAKYLGNGSVHIGKARAGKDISPQVAF